MLIIHHHTPLHTLNALLNNIKTTAYHFLEMGAICNISFVKYDLYMIC
jgi:hypothetical protein